ncbi:HEAT repeat domain-containing protein [Gimesia aquarii]|uniref:HEAT repeat protein n=1 Tax=Gimesia aquarii TaxID=2527964 RepID=A0A517VWA6_9PLAN|nr:HEAT repeat domain-containing protein [Gimesia aquarii]QDT97289.1 hypothetical protein V144x_27610 [Gimesia aquarii]
MAKKTKTPRTTKQVLALVKDRKKTVNDRIQALSEMSIAVCDKKSALEGVINILTDVDEEFEVREEALRTLQAASFSVVRFESSRPAYVAALRKVAKDENEALREQAFEILAAQQDGQVQRNLIKGLKDPNKAKIAPERALQLLAYDSHADAYDVARHIFDDPPSKEAKREALRLLSSDSKAVKIFSKVLRDKAESTEVRQICAAALHSLEPKTLYRQAKQIVLDKTDSDNLHATCLSALTYFNEKLSDKDGKLVDHVRELKTKASSKVKKRASAFLKRFGDND